MALHATWLGLDFFVWGEKSLDAAAESVRGRPHKAGAVPANPFPFNAERRRSSPRSAKILPSFVMASVPCSWKRDETTWRHRPCIGA